MALDEIVNATLASFAAVTSANEGRTICLDQEYSGDIGLMRISKGADSAPVLKN